MAALYVSASGTDIARTHTRVLVSAVFIWVLWLYKDIHSLRVVCCHDTEGYPQKQRCVCVCLCCINECVEIQSNVCVHRRPCDCVFLLHVKNVFWTGMVSVCVCVRSVCSDLNHKGKNSFGSKHTVLPGSRRRVHLVHFIPAEELSPTAGPRLLLWLFYTLLLQERQHLLGRCVKWIWFQ